MAAAYSASKAGVIGLTKSIGKDVATTGVLVNCIAPAPVDTPMLGDITQEHVDYMLSRVPIGRLATRRGGRRADRLPRQRPHDVLDGRRASTSRAAGPSTERRLDRARPAARAPGRRGCRRPPRRHRGGCAGPHCRPRGRRRVVALLRAGDLAARIALRRRSSRRTIPRRWPCRRPGAAAPARPGRELGERGDLRAQPRRSHLRERRARTSTRSSTTPSGPRSSSRTPRAAARSGRVSARRRARRLDLDRARARARSRARRATATLLGATAANDVTARDIEGANPLYLPQAKLFGGLPRARPGDPRARRLERAVSDRAAPLGAGRRARPRR